MLLDQGKRPTSALPVGDVAHPKGSICDYGTSCEKHFIISAGSGFKNDKHIPCSTQLSIQFKLLVKLNAKK